MVSQLLYELPSTERYRVIFMERDLEEVLESQEKMRASLGRPSAPRDAIKPAYFGHLEKLHARIARQSYLSALYVNYNVLIADPVAQAARVGAFLGGRGDVEAMIGSVDRSLYRNRKAPRHRPDNAIADDDR